MLEQKWKNCLALQQVSENIQKQHVFCEWHGIAMPLRTTVIRETSELFEANSIMLLKWITCTPPWQGPRNIHI